MSEGIIALHPLCALFPRLDGAEFEALRDDIKANGLRQPIVVHDGMILDGGNRYRACLDAGVTPEFVKFDGSNIVSFVLSANLHRRHMTPGQQAAIVASAQDWSKAQKVGNPQLRNVAQLETAADRAAQSGASHRTQQMADKVAKADPELAKKVAHGEISLPKAVEQISPKKPELKVVRSQEEKNTSEPSQQASEFTVPAGKRLVDEDDYNNLLRTLDETVTENEVMSKVLDEDDKLVAAMAEIKRLNALVSVLEDRVRSLQNTKNEAIRTAKYWKNKCERTEKSMGVV